MPYPGTRMYDIAIQQGFVEPQSLFEWLLMNHMAQPSNYRFLLMKPNLVYPMVCHLVAL